MASSISLDKSSQSTFRKAVKNIKTLIKKNELKIRDQSGNDAASATGKKAVLGKKKADNQQDSQSAWKKDGRGVVYLSHIPQGFYEEEMHSYFSQFGWVTRLNLIRSKKNGKPKGYAFIEFLYSEVAQVVAETMNNYLMCDRLLKAEYIPGERTYRGMFRNSYIRPDNCPRRKSQKKWIQNTNKTLTPEEEAGTVSHEIRRLSKLKEQLEKSGIHLDCQIESSSLTPLNSDIIKTGRYPVLQIDESDSEIEFKLQPNVTRILKRSFLTSPPSTTAKKLKAEAKKSVSKLRPQCNGTLAVKRRSLSASILSPSAKKMKGEMEKDVTRNNLQPTVASVMKVKPLLLSPSLKKVKAKRQRDISKTESHFSVTKVVEQKSLSTSIHSPSVNKVKARKDLSKNRQQPNVTPGMKRKSFSTSLLSPNVKKGKAKKERDMSSTMSQFIVTDMVEHRPLSPSMLSPHVKKVKAKAEKVVSDVKLQPNATEVAEDKSLSSVVSCNVKNVKAESKEDVRKTKTQLTVTKAEKDKSLSKSVLSTSVKKVKDEAEKGRSETESKSGVTRVVKRKHLRTSALPCNVKKVKAKGGHLKRTRPSGKKQGVSMRCDSA